MSRPGRIALLSGNAMTIADAVDCDGYRPGDRVRLAVDPMGTPRSGAVSIIRVDRLASVLYGDNLVSAMIPAACVGDYLVIEHRDSGSDDDHDVLVAYLLSAVRRRDWHAVSDAANDLRVLEARRR